MRFSQAAAKPEMNEFRLEKHLRYGEKKDNEKNESVENSFNPSP